MRTLTLCALLALPGCALSTRTVGMQDPSVEIVRALAEVMKAQAHAPVAVTPAGMLTCDCWDPGCPSPAPGPEMTPELLSYLSAADIKRCQKNAVKRLTSPEGGAK